MIKYSFCLLLILSVVRIHAQSLDYLKEQDTLYLLLDDYDTENTTLMREHFKKFDWEISANSKISRYSITDSLRRVITIVERKVGDTITINVKVKETENDFLNKIRHAFWIWTLFADIVLNFCFLSIWEA
ncbi:hypothetical protein VF12_37015 [Nostoc linckia z15]|nr:hypothetical protein VF12_37015 [Nostoc linckia z15]